MQYQANSSTQNRENSQKSRFWLFFCIIGLILHDFALQSGNFWFSSGLEQLVLPEYALSSISKLPKSKKSTKTSFSKIFEKWLSLEAWWPLEIQGTLKCPKFRFSPFIFANWTILTDLEHNLFFRKISTDGRFWPV